MTESQELVPFGGDDELELLEEEEGRPGAEEIAAQISEISDDVAQLTREAQEIASEPIEDADTGSALVPANVSPEHAKRRLAKVRADVARKQQALDRKQAEIRERQEQMKELMHQQAALAKEMMAPLEKLVARLGESIWMVNLYLGRDEEILLLQDGEPAPAEEPVAIRQMVLAMDEECAINPEEEGIDATNIFEFDDWLRADPAHAAQVAPEPRCVVALRPRFKSKLYKDPWKAAAVDEADRKTYFLIRNGERLFRTWTEFNVGERLVPNASEFASFFYAEPYSWERHERIRVPLQPGTLAWEEAEEKADAHRRHYMRVGLILQGLVDRTTVFHPLPERGINFLDLDHHGKSWRFVLDAEMAIGTGRKPFYEWLAEKNAELRVGMRIVGAFDYQHIAENPEGERPRIWPKSAERPPTGELLMIEDKTDDGFVIRYPRTEEVYDPKIWRDNPDRPGWGWRGGSRVPKRRASYTIDPDDKNIIPFDLVSEEEMRAYLGARLDRHAYVDMFPLLKAAIHAKQAEREQEAPFRVMLCGVLARENGVEVAEAEADLDSLIEWWKLTNKNHRPLVGGEEAQAKAVRMIVAEHARRLKAKRADASLVQQILVEAPGAILVGRKRDGKYVALVPENDENIFVREIEFGVRGGGSEKRWKTISKARVARWDVAYETERYREWDFAANPREHLTGPEFERLAAEALADAGERAVAVAYYPRKHAFHTWRLLADAQIDEEHPLSGKQEEVEVEHVERRWTREGRELKLWPEHTSYHSEWVDQRRPWDTRTVDGKPSRYHDANENLYTVLYENEALYEHIEAEKERYKAASAQDRALRERASKLLRSIEQAWVQRQEAIEYARFLEEYLDPDLWEGHRKTLPSDRFEYPHRHYSRSHWGRSVPDMLAATVEHAVENDIDLNGMTVREAIGQHFPDAEWLDRRLAREDVEDDEATPTLADAPDDVREFRFSVSPPNAKEEEEE